jgi:hypothetical protein
MSYKGREYFVFKLFFINIFILKKEKQKTINKNIHNKH